MIAIKDKEGKFLVNEVLQRWREHFEEVLHVQRPDIFLPVIDQAPGVITSIDTGDISIAEKLRE